MENILENKLHSYLVENNPDMLLSLEQETKVTAYIKGKVSAVRKMMADMQQEGTPSYIIEEILMEELTSDLRPSRYNLLLSILQTEFGPTYESYREMGILTYELSAMINSCKHIFEQMPFTREEEENNRRYYAITGAIADYLENKK
ncbi:DUF1896 family protein [Chitinophaga sp. CC14]|uniref:DUF1896 family protein n=1 Tax=Chitinophaga sp. CC14 TaxID=3029199 RepID=UPI003B762A22